MKTKTVTYKVGAYVRTRTVLDVPGSYFPKKGDLMFNTNTQREYVNPRDWNIPLREAEECHVLNLPPNSCWPREDVLDFEVRVTGQGGMLFLSERDIERTLEHRFPGILVTASEAQRTPAEPTRKEWRFPLQEGGARILNAEARDVKRGESYYEFGSDLVAMGLRYRECADATLRHSYVPFASNYTVFTVPAATARWRLE